MATDIIKSLTDQIRELVRRVRDLELSTYIYAKEPDTPATEVTVTGLAGAVTYYVEPVSLLPKAVVAWTWNTPNNPDDPVVEFWISVTRSTDPSTTAFQSVGLVNSTTTSGLPVNINVTFRIYAITRSGIKGPTSSYTAVVNKTTTAPPQPATPTTSSAIKGIRVANNGLSSGGAPMPEDFDYYELHALNNGTATFTPTTSTLWSKMGLNEVAYVTANDSYQNIAVRLVAVNTSGLKSPASTGVVTTPQKIVDSDSNITLPTGAAYSDVGNLVLDGSFETTLMRNFRDSQAEFPSSVFSFVEDPALAQQGRWFIKAINSVGGAVVRSGYIVSAIDSGILPWIVVIPESKYYLSAQVRNIGANGDGWIYIAWVDNVGTYTYSNIQCTPANTATGDWEWKAAVFTAPANVRFARVAVSIRANATVGEWHFDSIEMRQVMGTMLIEDAAITRAKIGAMAVGTAEIEEVDAGLIRSGYISSDRFQAGTIEARHIKLGAVDLPQLSPTLGKDLNIDENSALSDMASAAQLTDVSNNLNTVQQSVQQLNNVVDIGVNGVTISQDGSPFALNLNNSSLDFYEGASRVAYINGQTMYIRSAEITNQLKIGVHIIEKYDNTNTFIRWVG